MRINMRTMTRKLNEKNQKNFFWPKIVEIYKQVFSVLRKDPTLFILFSIIAFLDLLALLVLFFAPTPPVSYILAPIIRNFWSEKFLHYPYNFSLLPKLFNCAHFLITMLVGVFVSGLVIKKIEGHIVQGEHLSILSAARPVSKTYFSLIVAWLISYGFFSFSLKALLPLVRFNIWLQILVAFFASVIFQALVAFFLPAILILKGGFLRKMWKALNYGAKNILTTGILIALPVLLLMVFSFFKMLTPYYLKVYPEMVLWVLVIGIAIMTVVDVLITSSTPVLFLKVREKS